jgi:hypothetical protein
MNRAILVIALLLSAGCAQTIARNWGGHVEVKLPNCQRLVTAALSLPPRDNGSFVAC